MAAVSDHILVYGSNSFSGATFVNYLLNKHPDAKVIGMSRSQEPHPAFLPYADNKNKAKFQFIKADLNHDLNHIESVVTEFKPRYFFNFASQSMVGESWNHPDHWYMTNVVSTAKLFQRLAKADKMEKYVHISTPEVYGSTNGWIKEHYNYNPSTPYATSRAACDMHLMNIFNHSKFPVVFTRAANVYGPGQQLYRILPRTVLFMRLGNKLQLHGGGESVRSFIHMDDVSDCTMRVAQKGNPPDVFHISTDRQISIRDLVALIATKMNKKFEDCVEIVGERAGKDAAYLLDSTKARTELGWKDSISLETGIDQTIAWVEKNLNELKAQPFNYIHKA